MNSSAATSPFRETAKVARAARCGAPVAAAASRVVSPGGLAGASAFGASPDAARKALGGVSRSGRAAASLFLHAPALHAASSRPPRCARIRLRGAARAGGAGFPMPRARRTRWTSSRRFLARVALLSGEYSSARHRRHEHAPFARSARAVSGFAAGRICSCASGSAKRGARPKALLVDALGDLLPEEIVSQRKRTFTFPWENWLRGALGKRVAAGWPIGRLPRTAGRQEISRSTVWKDFLAGRTTWSRPWSLYVLNEWVKRNVGAGIASSADAINPRPWLYLKSWETARRDRARHPINDDHSWHQRLSRQRLRGHRGGRPPDRGRRRRAAESREVRRGLPARAIQFCLDRAGAKLTEVDHIAIPRDPWARLGTKLRFAMRMPRFALDRVRVMRRFAGIREDLAAAFDIAPEAIRAQFHRIEHHTRAYGQRVFRFAVRTAPRCSPPTAWAISPAPCGPWAKARTMRTLGEVAFPAFAGHVLHGAHAVSRLLEIRRRIQGDGPGGLRPAGISGRIPQDRPRRRRRFRSGWASNISRIRRRAPR